MENDITPWKRVGKPVLTESVYVPGTKAYQQRGVFQNYKLKNANGRIYPRKLWEKALSPGSDFYDRLQRRNVLGMVEHPEDGITRALQASHVIIEAHIATPSEIASSNGELIEGDIVGTYEVINATEAGKAIKGFIEQNIDFGGVSSRGNGTVTETSEALEVNDDYVLETWDIVFSPSVARARPKALKEDAAVVTKGRKLKESDGLVRSTEDLQDVLLDHGFVLSGNSLSKGGTEVVLSDGKIVVQKDGQPVGEYTPAGVVDFLLSNGCLDTEADCNITPQPPMTESSFVLITGLYGPGKPTENKKLIPIQLIAESGAKGQSFYWESKEEGAPKLGKFSQFNEAMSAMTTFCETTGAVFTTSEPPKPISENTNTNTSMNASDRIRQIQAEAVLLKRQSSKGLRLSEASALLEKARSLRIELSQLGETHTHLSSMIKPINKLLEEYEEEMDAPPVEPEAEGPPPAEDTPPPAEGDVAPPAGEDITAEQAQDILSKAVEDLKAAGKDASGLEMVASQIADADVGGEGGVEDLGGDDVPEDDFDIDAEAPPIEDADVPKLESSYRARKNFVEAYRKIRSRYSRLVESTTRLFRAYKNLNESKSRSGTEGSSVSLREALSRATKSEAAAREIAERFNSTTMELGSYIWKLREPALYEANKKRLSECKSWKQFEDLSRNIMLESKSADEAALEGDEEDEVTEAAKPKPETKPVLTEAAAPVKAEVHPQVASILRARSKGSNMY